MKHSHKLDLLQEMARAHADNPRAVYLIALLVEHTQEEEMDEGFLRWAEGFLVEVKAKI